MLQRAAGCRFFQREDFGSTNNNFNDDDFEYDAIYFTVHCDDNDDEIIVAVEKDYDDDDDNDTNDDDDEYDDDYRATG